MDFPAAEALQTTHKELMREASNTKAHTTHSQRHGDCAELVPIAITANNCAGTSAAAVEVAVSLALTLQLTISKISRISSDN